MTNTLRAGSKKNSLNTNASDSPLHSTYLDSDTNSTLNESVIVSMTPALDGHGHGYRHGHLMTESPASSAMAVHGSVPPSPLLQKYESLHLGMPMRRTKRTKVKNPVWQEQDKGQSAVEADDVGAKANSGSQGMEQVVEEHMKADMAENEERGVDADVEMTEEKGVKVKNGRVIALDFDDVCCQSMVAYCQEHNELWGTSITS
jgi:hypothetical protein